MKFLQLIAVISFLLSCSSATNSESESGFKEYIAIHNSDSAILRISIIDDNFYGQLKILKRRVALDSGIVEGKVHGDTLLGSFYYQPYKTQHKNRKAISFLKTKDGFIEGSGLKQVYMGIPSFIPESVSFDNPKFVFKER